METETRSPPMLRDLRWYPPILGLLFVTALATAGAYLLADVGSNRSTLGGTAIALSIAFFLMLEYFGWQIFLHFLWNTHFPTWVAVMLVLIVITSLGIAAILFSLFLVFAYFPGELKRELEAALPEPELEQRFRDLRDNLERISAQFVSEAGLHIAAFTQKYLDDAVLQNPLQAKSLGHERLGILKREVAEFISAVPSHVAERIGVSVDWPHRARASNSVDEAGRASTTDLKAAIDDTISIMLGPLGTALVRHDFTKSGLLETWLPLDQSERLKYRDKIKWSQEMNSRFAEYCSTYGDMTRVERALTTIHQGRERDEAKQLWESS